MFRSCLCAAIAVVLLIAPTASASAQPAPIVDRHEHNGRSHDHVGLCSVAAIVCAGGKIVEGAAGVAGSVIGGGAEAVANTAMSGVVSWAADGAAWLLGQIAGVVDRSTRPALGSEWYRRDYGGMAELAIALSALFLLLAVGHSIVHQDLGALLRAALFALPLSLLLTFAALTLVLLALAVTDWMTEAILANAGGDPAKAFKGIGDLFAAGPNSTLAPFVVFLTAVFTAVLALVVWIELVLRESAIYVAAAFLPLTFVAIIWRTTAVWCRRLAEGLVAIILSKFAVAVAFTLAAGALGNAAKTGGGGLSAIVGGCGVLLVAALSPWALMRLVPLTQSAPDQSLNRQQVGGAVRGAPGVNTATGAARLLMFSHFGGAAGAAHAASRPPTSPGPSQPPASRPPDVPIAKIPSSMRAPNVRG
jgi:hypothetical protein